ncbi:hypothetical protein TrST_g7681 [Triparma strigata]|uniref:Uncharacterized protein n=1 Tax=Triparma strigata TaxID=1606541 RepID=A0A9W7DZR0_9STRA|nr:hypothetical protein TrST_g7681 [Triparma strigata]
MGALGSSPIVEPFDMFKSWQLSQARDMLLAYRSRDFDFGVDASVITSLIGGDTQMAESIAKAFSPTSGVVNALSFLSAVILLSNDGESPNPTKSKSDLIFDTFDFQESGDMSLDEITILLLSVCRACNVICGTGGDPSDETMEQFALVMYQSSGKEITQFIDRKEFGSWIAEWVGTDNVDFAYLISRFAPSALITPEQQVAFELQAKLDAEKAEEEAKQRRELELKKRLEIEEAARKEAEEKVRVEREKIAAEKAAEEARLEAERKAEEARLAEIKRVKDEKIAAQKKAEEEAKRLAEEARLAEDARLKAEEEAKLKEESDAAATKLQNLKRAKDAREKVQARRESLAKLEDEAKKLEGEAKEKDAPPTLTEALLDVAAGEDDDAAAKLESLEKAKLAQDKVKAKEAELAGLQEEAKEAGGGLDGSLKGLLDDAAEEDDELSKVKAAQASRGRIHTVEHSTASKALVEASKLKRAGGEEEEEEEGEGKPEAPRIGSTPSVDEAKIKAIQAARGRTHTVEHSTAPEALKVLEAAGKLARGEGEGDEVDEDDELFKVKAAQAARGRTHTVEHSTASKALVEASKMERAEEEDEEEGEDAEDALEKELLKELEIGGDEGPKAEEKKEEEAKKELKSDA